MASRNQTHHDIKHKHSRLFHHLALWTCIYRGLTFLREVGLASLQPGLHLLGELALQPAPEPLVHQRAGPPRLPQPDGDARAAQRAGQGRLLDVGVEARHAERVAARHGDGPDQHAHADRAGGGGGRQPLLCRRRRGGRPPPPSAHRGTIAGRLREESGHLQGPGIQRNTFIVGLECRHY